MTVSQRTKPVTVTLPPDVIQKIKQISRSEDRSFSNALTQIVRRAALQAREQEATS
jgi:hypothetical protein